MAKEILVNQLFAGEYLGEGENIGHEVINFFKDDDGNNNIFVTSSGDVDRHDDIEAIIFVRQVSRKTTAEIVAYADGLRSVSENEVKQIRYANASLGQIFDKNSYHGKAELVTESVTFRADTFRYPSHRIFLTVDDVFASTEDILRLNSNRNYVLSRKARVFYSEETDKLAYDQLKDLINSGDNWEKENSTKKLIPDGAARNQNPTFLEIIKKEDDEIVFSNMLGYYFDFSHYSFQKFATDVLQIHNMSVSFDVTREYEHVDIWIESENDIIVIENKIRSGINGIKGGGHSQLDDYYEKAKIEAAKKNKTPHYYLFAPNYAKLDLSAYKAASHYTVIRYREIYNFFVRESATYIADRVFPDFLRGLKRHSIASLPELEYEKMRSRLLQRIN